MARKGSRSNWECSPFGPPQSAGVYVLMEVDLETKKHTPLFIGSSRNIHKRILRKDHPYRQCFIHDRPVAVFIRDMEEGRNELAKKLIKRLRPVLNIQGKNKDYGKATN